MAYDTTIKDSLNDFKFPSSHIHDGSEYIDSIICALFYSNIISSPSILLLSDISFLLKIRHQTKVLL